MKLHPIIHTNHSNLWCGIAAIASITGLDTKMVHDCARDVCRRPYIKGMYENEVQRTLRALGYVARLDRKGRWLTLADWIRFHRPVFAKRPVILAVATTHFNHYVTLLGNKFIDSAMKNPVPLKRARHKQARVLHFLIVEKI